VILSASPDEVTCEWEVSEKHHQPYGIVHGGVHSGVIESLASIGAALVAHPRGQRVVGWRTPRRSSARCAPASCTRWRGPSPAAARARCGKRGSATIGRSWWRRGTCACSASTRARRWVDSQPGPADGVADRAAGGAEPGELRRGRGRRRWRRKLLPCGQRVGCVHERRPAAHVDGNGQRFLDLGAGRPSFTSAWTW